MGSTKNFDPDLVQFLFAGIPIEGYAEGTMIDIEYSDEAFKVVRGVDGQLTRSKVLGRFATVTVHLMNSSRSNATFSAIHNLDLLEPGGAGISPIMIRDGNGASLFVSDESWVNGFPAGSYGEQASNRDWKITVAAPKVVEGGI